MRLLMTSAAILILVLLTGLKNWIDYYNSAIDAGISQKRVFKRMKEALKEVYGN